MEEQQRQAAGNESKRTVASNGQQKGVMAGSRRLATLNDESGQQTTKHKAGTDATTNHQQESGEGQQQPTKRARGQWLVISSEDRQRLVIRALTITCCGRRQGRGVW